LPEFEYQWDEHRYRFASAEHRICSKPILSVTPRRNFCHGACLNQVVVANPETGWSAKVSFTFSARQRQLDQFCSRRTYANITKANQNRPILPKDQHFLFPDQLLTASALPRG
jgi:hypothetical protein